MAPRGLGGTVQVSVWGVIIAFSMAKLLFIIGGHIFPPPPWGKSLFSDAGAGRVYNKLEYFPLKMKFRELLKYKDLISFIVFPPKSRLANLI